MNISKLNESLMTTDIIAPLVQMGREPTRLTLETLAVYLNTEGTWQYELGSILAVFMIFGFIWVIEGAWQRICEAAN